MTTTDEPFERLFDGQTSMIAEGFVCMRCLCTLIDDHGDPCDAGHPLLCADCWNKDKRAKREGAPYFDEKTGSVCTG